MHLNIGKAEVQIFDDQNAISVIGNVSCEMSPVRTLTPDMKVAKKPLKSVVTNGFVMVL